MNDADNNPLKASGPSVIDENISANVATDVDSGATESFNLASVKDELLRLKEVAPEQYAALLEELPPADLDAEQRLVKYLAAEDFASLRSYIVRQRDKDPKTFRDMILGLQVKDVGAFQKLVSELMTMAQEALHELFQKLEVTKIVCVDDEYGRVDVEDIVGLIGGTGVDLAKKISYFDDIALDPDPMIYKEQLAEKLEASDANTIISVCNELRELVGERTEHGYFSTIRRDARDAGFLSLLLKDMDFVPLSRTQWMQQREMLLDEAVARNTLFLFDQDLSHDGGGPREGIGLLEAVLGSTDENVLCGLLSHTITLDNEYSEWKKYCTGADERGQAYSHRFILISKSHLYPDPMSFVRMAKLTVLNARCKRLVEKAGIVFEKAHKEAIAEVNKTDIYDFEHLVFRSSQHEGVWEPDTLFRLMGVYHRVKARKEARGTGNELEKLADDIRAVSGIVTGPRYSPSKHTWQIRHYELYEDSELINQYHMPLELGDIFKTGSGKLFILLRQSCDLMLRKDKQGERHYAVTEAEVAEIVSPFDADGKPKPGFDKNGKPGHPEDYEELPCFDPATGQSRYVSFRSRKTVALFVLDLCVFNKDGNARLTLGAEAPEGLTALWRLHYKAMQQQTDKYHQKYIEIKKQTGRSDTEACKAFPQSSNLKDIFHSSFDAPTTTLKYDCSRLLRLCQPRAGTVLTRYATYLSRDAFEHDFTEELPIE